MTNYDILQKTLDAITFTSKPKRPKAPGAQATSEYFIEYGNLLVIYEAELAKYSKERDTSNELRTLAYDVFKDSIRLDYQELSNKQFDMAYYEVLRSNELYNLECILEELVDFIQEFNSAR